MIRCVRRLVVLVPVMAALSAVLMAPSGRAFAGSESTGEAVAAGDDGETLSGQVLAEEKCARCHAIGASGESRHMEAPSFREIAGRYPVWSLAEAFAEGIVTGHADMPEFKLEPAEIGALLSYIEGLAPEAGEKGE